MLGGDADGSGGCDGRRRKGIIGPGDAVDDVLVQVVVATVVVMAAPTVQGGEVTWCWVVMVVMAALGGYKLLPAQALCKSHSSSLQKQWLRESASCAFPTHSMPSGANNWLLIHLAFR